MDGADSPRSHVFIRDVPPFDPLTRPGRFSEKREAGFHAGVVEETADWDANPHLGPPIPLDQFLDDGLQRDPVQWIAGMRNTHDCMVHDMGLMAEDQRRFATLVEAIRHYQSPKMGPALDRRLKKAILIPESPFSANLVPTGFEVPQGIGFGGEADIEAIAAFLATLTDSTLLTDPKFSDPFRR